VHLQDLQPALLVRPVHEHLPVETAGPQERRIENLGPVRSREQDQAPAGVETVQLGEQLVQCLFLLVMPSQ
jgi:hypothetical protein